MTRARRARPRRRMRLALPVAVALLLVAGCGGDDAGAPPHSDAVDNAGTPQLSDATDDARLVLRPGDGLLDLLPLARFAVEPGPGVPDSFRAPGAAGFVLRTPVIPVGAWRPLERPPEAWAEVLGRNGDPRLWRAELPATPAPGARPLRVLVDDQELPAWDPEHDPMPARWAWWDPTFSMVFGVGDAPPSGVSFDVPVDPMAEVGSLMPTDRTPVGHVRRRALGDVTRPALLMPPPGVLELRIDELRAERLHLSLGVLDRAWALFDDAFHRTTGRSDGARFAVEVDSGAGPERVFERAVPTDAVGGEWIDAVVDLSAWRGQGLTLRLVSEPGADGDAQFDWTVWGDLRLRGGEPSPPSRAHVLLVHVDTLRADRVGGAHSRTPRLDAWAAAHALRFDDALAPASWTLPSTVSLFTGLAVHQHGVERHGQALEDGARTLAERLSEAGYETWGLAAGGYLRPSFGVDQGFDRYETAAPENLDWSSALSFVRERDSSRPAFLFLHTYHVHAPYPHEPGHAPPAYAGPLAGQDVDYGNVIDPYRAGELALDAEDLAYVSALYDAQVGAMDASLGALLEALERELADEGLLVVVTSDHGEAFGEHGVLEHGQALWQELLAVPLLLRLPDGRPGRRDDPASLVDVVPTVLDVLGLPADAGLAGSSLAERQPQERVRIARLAGEVDLEAVRSGPLKLVRSYGPGSRDPTGQQMFDLAADPGERDDLSTAAPRKAEALARRGQAFEEAHPPPQGELSGQRALGDDVSAQLRELGYLSDG